MVRCCLVVGVRAVSLAAPAPGSVVAGVRAGSGPVAVAQPVRLQQGRLVSFGVSGCCLVFGVRAAPWGAPGP